MGKINMVEVKAAENPDEIRYIVRIVGKDLNGLSPVWHALLGIKGIGQRMAVMMARVFESKTGIEYDAKLGEIPDDKHKVLEDIVMHPGNYGIPSWAFNRGKDIESGKDTHLGKEARSFRRSGKEGCKGGNGPEGRGKGRWQRGKKEVTNPFSFRKRGGGIGTAGSDTQRENNFQGRIIKNKSDEQWAILKGPKGITKFPESTG